jgi:hypothetical protein
VEWIEDVLDTPLDEEPLGDLLKSGVVLCNLVNRLSPGAVKKISESAMPFPQRENVQAFISAARELGVPDRDNFDTSDLFEQTGMRQVLICLRSLGRAAYNIPGYEGPCWGQQESGRSGPPTHQVTTDGGLWGKAGGGFGSVGGGVQVDASSRGVTPSTAEPARIRPPPRSKAATTAPTSSTVELAMDEAAAAREDRVAALGGAEDPMESAQHMILATLENEGGSCRYSRLYEEADKQKCGVLADALLACKRSSPPLVSYEGVMLLMPAHKDTIVTLGAPQDTPRPPARKQPPIQSQNASGPPAIPTKTSPGKKGPPPVPRAAAPAEELHTYRSLRRAVMRSGFEMDSDKAGVLEKHQVVKALEARRNETGVLRVRIASGWVSSTTADGSVVLEVMSAAEAEAEAVAAAAPAAAEEEAVEATMPTDAPVPAAQAAAPALTPRDGFGLSKMRNYVCVKKTVIRSGFDMDSDKAGVLAVGAVIVPQRKQVNENGIARIKFSQGWVSMSTSDGDTIMEASDLPPTDLTVVSTPAASATPVTKVDTSDNARSQWSLPGVGPSAPTDEFADTDSTVESISVAGKVVDAGDKQASSDAIGSLVPVASCTVTAAVQVPGEDGEKDYTAYLVECAGLTGDTWVVAKRFSDFQALRDELVALGLDEVSSWNFPSKMTFFKSDEDVQAERVSGFGTWLSRVLTRQEVNSADEKAVLMFFRPDPAGTTAAATRAADRLVAPADPAAVRAEPSGEPTAPAPAHEEEEVIGAYTAVLKSVVRAGFSMDSEKVGTIKKGEEVLCYEERENENGVTRVRFDRGWVSLTSASGDTILEPVE